MVLALLLSSLTLADTGHTRFAVCGQPDLTVTMHQTDHTLGALGLRLHKDVDESTPIHLISAADVDLSQHPTLAQAIAKTMGYRVGWRQVRLPRTPAPLTEATVLILDAPPDEQRTTQHRTQQTEDHFVVAWPGVPDLLEPLSLLAHSAGAQDGITAEVTQIGPNFSMNGPYTSWFGNTTRACEQIATRMAPIFLIEEGTPDVSFILMSPQHIEATDLLDVTAALAQTVNTTVTEDQHLVLIRPTDTDTDTDSEDVVLVTLIPVGTEMMGVSASDLSNVSSDQVARLLGLDVQLIQTRLGNPVFWTRVDPLTRTAPATRPDASADSRAINQDTLRQVFASDAIFTLPHRGADGTLDGYRLSGLRRNTLGTAMGFRNGDILHSIDGHPITEDGALEAALAALPAEGTITVEVTRRGRMIPLHYSVHPDNQTPAEEPQPAPAPAAEVTYPVVQVSESHYQIPQGSFQDDALSTLLLQQVRITPHQDPSGTPDGVRLSAVRPGSLSAVLGFKNGDIIHSINTLPLTSASDAMEVYTNLQDQTDFSVQITRRGRGMTLRYEVVPEGGE